MTDEQDVKIHDRYNKQPYQRGDLPTDGSSDGHMESGDYGETKTRQHRMEAIRVNRLKECDQKAEPALDKFKRVWTNSPTTNGIKGNHGTITVKGV